MNAPSDAAPAPSGCPQCGAEVSPHDSFCENCGGDLEPTETAPGREGTEAPIELSRSIRAGGAAGSAPSAPPTAAAPPCTECGGVVGEDRYCQTCGAKAPSPRDHFEQSPAPWVGGVCDRGRRHHRNEDAMALDADPTPGQRAVLVVCDGVSTAPESDVASLAAANTARELLARQRPVGLGTAESRAGAVAALLVEAGHAANRAVGAGVAAGSDNAPSCTFAAAVVDGDLCVYGLVGDSRVYWLPDEGEAAQLGEDDSVAAMRMAAGVGRVEAESGPGAHAITRWLGPDSPDTAARTGSLRLDVPGWVLVCSDGLWNYGSEPPVLQRLVAEQTAAGRSTPTALAGALVDWANEQGGRDNITVALARFGPPPSVPVPPADGPVAEHPSAPVETTPLESDQPTRNLSAPPAHPAPGAGGPAAY